MYEPLNKIAPPDKKLFEPLNNKELFNTLYSPPNNTELPETTLLLPMKDKEDAPTVLLFPKRAIASPLKILVIPQILDSFFIVSINNPSLLMYCIFYTIFIHLQTNYIK